MFHFHSSSTCKATFCAERAPLSAGPTAIIWEHCEHVSSSAALLQKQLSFFSAQQFCFMTQFTRQLKFVPRSISGHRQAPHIPIACPAASHAGHSQDHLLELLSAGRRQNTHVLKPYFKKHQFLKYPGEPAERAGAQQSGNVSYFSKPTYATSKRRERSHLRFVTWSPP